MSSDARDFDLAVAMMRRTFAACHHDLNMALRLGAHDWSDARDRSVPNEATLGSAGIIADELEGHRYASLLRGIRFNGESSSRRGIPSYQCPRTLGKSGYLSPIIMIGSCIRHPTRGQVSLRSGHCVRNCQRPGTSSILLGGPNLPWDESMPVMGVTT